MRHVRTFLLASIALVASGCVVASTQSPSQRWRPNDLVEAPRVSSIALLGALHPTDSMAVHADSLIPAVLATACPGVTVLDARATETRLEQRGVIIPRRITVAFARQAHEVLGTDLLLAPTVLGVLRGERGKWSGLWEQLTEDFEDESAGLSIEGWDLRKGRQAVRLIRSKSSAIVQAQRPLLIFENVATEALGAVAALCRADVSPVVGTPSGVP